MEKRIIMLITVITILALGSVAQAFTINQEDAITGLKYFILNFDQFFEEYVSTNNITADSNYYNGFVLCDNIVGGVDGDYCTDDSGVGGTNNWNSVDPPYLYNSSSTIILNDTYLNITIDDRSNVNGTGISPSYLNVVGSANVTQNITIAEGKYIVIGNNASRFITFNGSGWVIQA